MKNSKAVFYFLLILVVLVVIVLGFYYVYPPAKNIPQNIDSGVYNSTSSVLNPGATATSQNNVSTVSGNDKSNIAKESPLSVTPVKKHLKLSYPNGGETLALDSTQWIEWTSLEGLNEKVSIEIVEYFPECYVKDKYVCPQTSVPVAPLVIANDIPNMGRYNWVVGRDIMYGGTLKEGKKYKITIHGRLAENNEYVSDSSDNYFTVVSSKLKICPDSKIKNQMPTVQSDNNPMSVYFILNGQRRELSEFDLNWVGSNCNVKEEVVY